MTEIAGFLIKEHIKNTYKLIKSHFFASIYILKETSAKPGQNPFSDAQNGLKMTAIVDFPIKNPKFTIKHPLFSLKIATLPACHPGICRK
jgi:ubiquitin-protein ligase